MEKRVKVQFQQLCEEKSKSTILTILSAWKSTRSHQSAMTRMKYGQSNQWKRWVMASLWLIWRRTTSYAWNQQWFLKNPTIVSSVNSVALTQVPWGCTHELCVKPAAALPFSGNFSTLQAVWIVLHCTLYTRVMRETSSALSYSKSLIVSSVNSVSLTQVH